MYNNIKKISAKYKIYFPIVAKLLGSGVLTSLGFVLLSSGKIEYIPKELSLEVLLFIQFQIIGITIVKYGLDTLVFAKMMESPNQVYDPLDYIKRRGVILSFLCAVVYSLVYDYAFAIVIFMTIILDVYSIIAIVQMNVKKKYNYAFFANIMAYPMFFLLFFISSLYIDYIYWQVILLYALCIFIRFFVSWLFINRYKNIDNISPMSIDVQFSLGLQQILNFGLFRLDQVLISLGSMVVVFLGLSSSDIRQILFLSRFPDLVSGVMVSLAFLYAPVLVIESKERFINIVNRYKWIFLLYFIGLLLALMVYLLIWNGEDDINMYYILPYLVTSMLIVFVNMTTLGYMKNDKVDRLVKNLFISTSLGLMFLGIISVLGAGKYMVLVVPFQMLIFLTLRLIK